jgi:hypothetical protein
VEGSEDRPQLKPSKTQEKMDEKKGDEKCVMTPQPSFPPSEFEVWSKCVLDKRKNIPEKGETQLKFFVPHASMGEAEVSVPKVFDYISEVWMFSHDPLERILQQFNRVFTDTPAIVYEVSASAVSQDWFMLKAEPQEKYVYKIDLHIRKEKIKNLSFVTTTSSSALHPVRWCFTGRFDLVNQK